MFPFLKEADAEAFIKICRFDTFDAKELILYAGSTSRHVFLTLSGFVRGYVHDTEGVEKNIILRGAGKFTSVPEWLFEAKPTRYNIEAISKSTVLMVSFPEFEALAQVNPAIFALYTLALKDNLNMIMYRLESQILLTPEERYYDLLEKHPHIFQEAYNKHIANFLGITPVSLSRLMKRRKDKEQSI
jgi:CRP-like cAMP-binding protein